MGFVPDVVGDVVDVVKSAPAAAASVVTDTVARGAVAVANLLDIGEATGNDGGSSNWAAWGHPEIRSMLDSSVDPEQVYAGGTRLGRAGRGGGGHRRGADGRAGRHRLRGLAR